MSNKKPLLLWSGGLDSTWMLWQELQKGDVDYVTINGGQCANKQVAETHARERALKWMHARTKYCARSIDCNIQIRLADMPALTWSQPVPWLVGALSVVDYKRHSSLQIGYVMGDEVALIHGTLKKTWECLQQISKQGDPVPLEFPLEMTSKLRILDAMPKGLYDCIWYCELPAKHEDPRVLMRVPCERCAACITHLTELYRYTLRFKDGREIGRADPAPLRDKDSGPSGWSYEKPRSTPEVVYAYMPVLDAYGMGATPDTAYTLLAGQVVYTDYSKIDYLKTSDLIKRREHHILGIQFPQPFERYLTQLTPGVFSLNQAIPSELIFATYSYYGEQTSPNAFVVDSDDHPTPSPVKENNNAAHRLLEAALNDSPITEESPNARLSLYDPSAVQELSEDTSAAQSV